MITISKFANSVQPSATLAVGAKARELRAKGVEVFDFSLGEPDFNTPAHICAAADIAIRAGKTHYTPTSGLPEVRKAVAEWYGRFHGYKIAADQVLLSNGAKHCIHNSLVATVGPGDEVIIPTPYWVSYSDLVEMTGAKPVLVPTSPETGFKFKPEQLRKAISPRARMVMLNSPCNPTGVVYSRSELEKLADVILESPLAVLSDEIYEQLTYGDAKPTCFATLRPALAERTLTISGPSKTYAMTGWRMGWTVGPKSIIDAMSNIQSQETSCSSSVSQSALLAALTGPQDCVGQMRAEFAKRRELVCRRLEAIPGIRFLKPEGAFYAFFDVSSYFNKPMAGGPFHDSIGFCQAALQVAHVAFVPGAAFGYEGYVRMSFASGTQLLEAGLDRFDQWLRGKLSA